MKKQWCKAAFLAGLICLAEIAWGADLGIVMAAQTGSRQSDEIGVWYELEDGSYVRNGWVEDNGQWYFADANGYLVTGWYKDSTGLYYLGEGGRMYQSCTVEIDGTVCRFDASGRCEKLSSRYEGWIQYDAGWKYRESNGLYPSGCWKKINDQWYYFDENAYRKTGWITVEGVRYLLGDDGVMVHDTTLVENGMEYTFDSTGAATAVFHYKSPTEILPEDQKTELMHSVDAMADQILAGIIHDGMSETQKARAIYYWVRGHLTYSGSGSLGDWTQAAYEGLRRRRGHCYTYYATSLALLSRAGIPSIEVIRSSDNNHWWNLVYVDGAWYHFDTTPRAAGGDFCLLTTGQLMAYSNRHNGSHTFDQSLYPPTP